MKRRKKTALKLHTRAKEKFFQVIRHRFFGASLTLLGVILPLVLFILTKNYRPLIYPPLHADTVSPQQKVEQVAQALPSNVPKPEVIEHGSRFKHQIALTFDADMTPAMLELLKKGAVKSWYNQGIKETLDTQQVKATIFFSGLWVKTYPDESKALSQDKLLEIGNHSFSHPAFTPNCFNLPVIDNAQDQNEIESAQWIISQTTAVVPKYFRFPGGCFDLDDLQTVSRLNLKVIHWDVAGGDGFNDNPIDIYKRVITHVKNGSIVALHIHGGPFAPQTNQALKQIIPDLKKQGYQFVTISELLKD